jgi:hypothetical protein
LGNRLGKNALFENLSFDEALITHRKARKREGTL